MQQPLHCYFVVFACTGGKSRIVTVYKGIYKATSVYNIIGIVCGFILYVVAICASAVITSH